MFEGIPLEALTPLGMLCFALAFPYLQMARGKLVPRSTLEDVIKDRDEWRSTSRISEEARRVAADQVDELLEHARTTDSFIRSLPHPGGQVSP